jgi:hypothetical protein
MLAGLPREAWPRRQGLRYRFHRTGGSTTASIAAGDVIEDIRHVTVEDLRGFDRFIHLAVLSNDPLGQLAPNITRDINFAAR